MGLSHSPRIVIDRLVLALDAGNSKNYNVGISTNWVDNVGGNNGTLVNGTYHNDGPFVGAGYVDFVGTGDKISAPAGSDFAYGTGDFTIEGWFYPTVIGQVSGAAAPSHILFGQTVAATNYLLFGIDANGKLLYYRTSAGGGSDQFSSAPNGSVVLNQWQHIALCRSSGTTKAFVDGQEIISISDTFNFNNTDRNPTIGNYTHSLTTQPFNGYISNFRILKGTGLYTSNFTPPTKPLTAVTNTVLLTCQGNTIIDASSSGHTLTASGNATANLGFPTSAIVFDGTDDQIDCGSSNNFAFGTGDFAIEFWFNADSGGGIISISPSGGNAATNWQIRYSSSKIRWIYSGTSSIESSTLSTGQWFHVVATRSGTALTLYINAVSEATGTSSANLSDTGVLRIGRNRDGISHFDGKVPIVRIYKGKGLTAAEVLQNYNALKGRYAFLPTLVQDGLVLNLDAGDTNSYPGSGTTWTDLSSNSNNGTLTNGPTYSSADGGSIVFDGTDDYVSETSGLSDSFLQGDWTISFWVNFDVISTNNTGNILLQHGTNSTRRGLHLEQRNSSLILGLYSDDLSGSQTLSTDTWYNITFTLNSTTRLQQIFVNGFLDNSRTANGAYVGTGSNTRIGGRALNFSSYLDGKISNVVAYNRVLSAQEISQNYNFFKDRY